jgi:hypothetical protein
MSVILAALPRWLTHQHYIYFCPCQEWPVIYQLTILAPESASSSGHFWLVLNIFYNATLLHQLAKHRIFHTRKPEDTEKKITCLWADFSAVTASSTTLECKRSSSLCCTSRTSWMWSAWAPACRRSWDLISFSISFLSADIRRWYSSSRSRLWLASSVWTSSSVAVWARSC